MVSAQEEKRLRLKAAQSWITATIAADDFDRETAVGLVDLLAAAVDWAEREAEEPYIPDAPNKRGHDLRKLAELEAPEWRPEPHIEAGVRLLAAAAILRQAATQLAFTDDDWALVLRHAAIAKDLLGNPGTESL